MTTNCAIIIPASKYAIADPIKMFTMDGQIRETSNYARCIIMCSLVLPLLFCLQLFKLRVHFEFPNGRGVAVREQDLQIGTAHAVLWWEFDAWHISGMSILQPIHSFLKVYSS